MGALHSIVNTLTSLTVTHCTAPTLSSPLTAPTLSPPLTTGEAYYRTKQWGPALKKFYAIQKHFQDYIDDMSDFHGFCLRKVSLRGVQIYGF